MARPCLIKWVLLLSLSFLGTAVTAQTAPYNGSATLDLGASISAQTQTDITVPINVDLNGITAIDSFGANVPAALGGIRVAITYDNTQLSAILDDGRVQAGTTTEFSTAPFAHVVATDNFDTLIIASSQPGVSVPTGLINIANVRFRVHGPAGNVVPLLVAVLDMRSPLLLLPGGQGPFGGVHIPHQVVTGSISIIENEDVDGDGMPDAWEIVHGLNPSDPNDAFLDADGDSLINRDEYVHGTDPQNPDSDYDGVPDAAEIQAGRSPSDPADFPLWIISSPETTATVLVPYSYTVLANLGAAQFFLDQAPTGMSIDALSGVIDWIPTTDHVGMHTVTVRITTSTEQAVQSYTVEVVNNEFGDVNQNGEINVGDLLLVMQMALGQRTPTPAQLEYADINRDGLINAVDVLLLQRIIFDQ